MLTALSLTACATPSNLTNATDRNVVCKAHGKPMPYARGDKNHPRHAGPVLADDLAARHRVGLALKCYTAPKASKPRKVLVPFTSAGGDQTAHNIQ